MTEHTFFLIKAGAVRRRQVIPILAATSIIEAKVTARGCVQLTPEMIDALYAEHKDKHFYPMLVESVTGDVVAGILTGKDVVHRWRTLMGATNASLAKPGTLRYDFGQGDQADNAVHGSATPADAVREIKLLFPHQAEALFAFRPIPMTEVEEPAEAVDG